MITTPLAVDHDHTSGAVLGLLCPPRDAGLGAFGDDQALHARAISSGLTGRSELWFGQARFDRTKDRAARHAMTGSGIGPMRDLPREWAERRHSAQHRQA
ncbi:endonuclease domain-containing protein [Nocardia sp. NBC_01499]|uniref:endonuclease domain-containing protein n=1 Tax=Nocardia sp. NBC_01499 TaxID=2903597 RepID=UPI00386A4721